MNFRTLEGLAVKGRRVIVRADLNVPMADGKVTDRLRIERQAPTIRELSDKGAHVIILSHFDRLDRGWFFLVGHAAPLFGKVNGFVN